MQSIYQPMRKLGRIPILGELLRKGGRWLNHYRHHVIHSVDGITYDLDLNEVIDCCIYVSGAFELETASAIKTLVGPGAFAVDVGANIGCHCLPMAQLVGASGKVVAFEPMDAAVAKLKRNIALNGRLASRISVVQAAIADYCGAATLDFKTSWPWFGPSKRKPQTVEVITLDSYAAGLPRLDFIKVDVDGYETKVIQGAMETLNRHRPSMVVEVCPDTAGRVSEVLSSLNYRLVTEQFRPLGRISIPEDRSINIIALPN